MVPGPYLPPFELKTAPAVQESTQRSVAIDDVLRVTFDDSEYDFATGETVFSGTVTATYGPTRITSRKLRINNTTKTGLAQEGVEIYDPEASLRASSVEFNWADKTGVARDVRLQAENVFVTAKEAQVFPLRWELKDATGSLARDEGAPVRFEAESVTINPGRGGVARRVFLRVFGTRIGPIPRISFTLRKRVKGLGIPSVTNRKGKGLGIAWDSSFALGDHAALSAFWESFPRREPGFGLQYSLSPLSPDATTLIAPQSDLDERYQDGWFDNISTRTVDEEHDGLRSPRNSVGVGTFWNQGTTGRPVDVESVSKAFELVAEVGGVWPKPQQADEPVNFAKTYGTLLSARFQRMRADNNQPFINRLMAEGTLLSPKLEIGPKFFGQARLDTFGSLSQNGTFGWGRVEAGLVYQPSQPFTFGLGVGLGSAVGTPDFLFDGLVANRALLARADYQAGPWTFRYLAKYDLSRHLWYDREYEIALVARQFEPYLVYRQFPSETRIGVRFRIDNLRDRLTRRTQDRRR